MPDTHQQDSAPNSVPQRRSEHVETTFSAEKGELGVENGLQDVAGVTASMLVELFEQGIKSIEDLADCATDDLDGWTEHRDGENVIHRGILDRFSLSRKDCEEIIINARVKVGWIKEAAVV